MTHYLSVATMFRDEAACLREWIAFHLMNGVEHFYLYDNGSTDDYFTEIGDFILAGRVSVQHWPDLSVESQVRMYNDAIGKTAGRSRWVAFIDVDELLFSPCKPTLCDTLVEFEQFPGVLVNWQVYGSSGLAEREGLVIESFTRRAHRNYCRNFRVKSIVDPRQVEAAQGVHFFRYNDGRQAVDESGKPVGVVSRTEIAGTIQSRDVLAARFATRDEVTVQKLRINHYAVKSRAEFLSKMQRFAHWPDPDRRFAEYWRIHDRNEVDDRILLPILAELRTRMS